MHLKSIHQYKCRIKAQGIGNILSSLLGGLPMTSVVVRTSANNNAAGAKSKMSAIIHGLLLLVSVLAIPTTIK
jgi:MFS superfamily sulfate permease-like transporter